MTSYDEVRRIKEELGSLYKEGELQQLLKSDDVDLDTLKFLAIVKDFYIQQDQKEIISTEKFIL